MNLTWQVVRKARAAGKPNAINDLLGVSLMRPSDTGHWQQLPVLPLSPEYTLFENDHGPPQGLSPPRANILFVVTGPHWSFLYTTGQSKLIIICSLPWGLRASWLNGRVLCPTLSSALWPLPWSLWSANGGCFIKWPLSLYPAFNSLWTSWE